MIFKFKTYKIMSTDLVKINASDYGLEESKASEIKAMFLPMLERMDELEVQYNEVLKQEISPETCHTAKELRLIYVKTRTGTAEIHKKLKAFYLAGGRFVDAFKNIQEAASGEKEKTLKAIEDHFENMERERFEKLRSERSALLKPYTEIEPLALGYMQQDVFDNYLAGVKLAYEAKIAAEKKAEADRLAAYLAEKAAIEKQRLENIRLQKEAKKREAEITAERKLIAEANEQKERLAEIERKKNAEILKAQQEKADKERAELFAQAEKERKEKERLASEIAAKKAAEEKAIKDAEIKKQAELKLKAAEEKRAKLAPDKDKLLAFMQAINDLARPEVKSIEAASISANANTLLVKVANYILKNANKL
jgi:hypothetical protein